MYDEGESESESDDDSHTVTIQEGTSTGSGRRVGHWPTRYVLISFSEQELLIEV